MVSEPQIYIAPADQPAWDALLAQWMADYQPCHFAFAVAVLCLAEASWSLKRHKRELLQMEAAMHSAHPGLPTVEWSAEEQKRWQTLVTRCKDADRLFSQKFTAAERCRKRRDDEGKAAAKSGGKPDGKPCGVDPGAYPSAAEPKQPQPVRPVEQHGHITSEHGRAKTNWHPTNEEIKAILANLSPDKVNSVVRRVHLPDPPPPPYLWAKDQGPVVSQQFTREEFAALAEREAEEQDPHLLPPGQSYSQETVLFG